MRSVWTLPLLIKHKFKMKKIIALFVFVALATTAKAQSFELKTNPFGMALGAYNITGEFILPEFENRKVYSVLGTTQKIFKNSCGPSAMEVFL